MMQWFIGFWCISSRPCHATSCRARCLIVNWRWCCSWMSPGTVRPPGFCWGPLALPWAYPFQGRVVQWPRYFGPCKFDVIWDLSTLDILLVSCCLCLLLDLLNGTNYMQVIHKDKRWQTSPVSLESRCYEELRMFEAARFQRFQS